MENVKLNIRALAAMKKISINALAVEAGISPDHLQNVSAGRATFTATDLARLVKVTGVPIEHINVDEP